LTTILVILGLGAPLRAAETIGKAERIENRVSGEIAGGNRMLVVPDAVYRDEMLRTGEKSQALIRFIDETDLRLGPKAAIKLDAFVFSGKRNAAMELIEGSMRFASGNGPKGSYLIRTPVATVGLRGTVVEVAVRGNRTFVSLHEGEARVCTRSGRCMELRSACTYLSVDNRGVSLPQPLSRRMPGFSTECTGEFCVTDRCQASLSSTGAGAPPAAAPPRTRPPKKVKPPRPRRRGRVQEEEIIIDEPEYLPPRGRVFVPGIFLEPGFTPPRFPGARPPRWPGGSHPPGGNRSPFGDPRGPGRHESGPKGGNGTFRSR
jgi:hypothetical protein